MEFEQMKQIICEVMNVEGDDITMNTRFVDDLGADSLDVMQIFLGIEETFGIEIDADSAEGITTVADAVEKITKLLESKPEDK